MKRPIRTIFQLVLSLFIVTSQLCTVLPVSAISFATNLASAESDCTNGTLLQFQGRTLEAIRLLERGLAAMPPANSSQSKAMCAMFLGLAYHSAAQFDQAIAVYQTALDIFTAAKDAQMQATLSFGLGSAYMMQGRLVKAKEYLDESLQIVEGDDQPWVFQNLKPLLRAATLNNLGIVVANGVSTGVTGIGTRDTYTYAVALDYLNDANKIFSALTEDNTNQPDQLEQFIDVLAAQLKLDTAEKAQLKFLVQALGVSDRLTEEDKILLQTLLPLLQSLAPGKPAPDINTLINSVAASALDPLIATLAQTFQPTIINNIGEVYRMQGKLDEALAKYDEASELNEQLSGASGEFASVSATFALANQGLLHNNRGIVYLARQEWELALEEFTKAQEILEAQMDNWVAAISIHANIGYIHRQLGENELAINEFEQAMDILERARTISESSLVRMTVGKDFNTLDALGMQGTLTQYADIYALAIDTYRQLGRDSEAFITSERSRARLFRDMLSQSQISGDSGKLLQQLQEAYSQLQFTISARKLQESLKPVNRSLLRYWQQEEKSAQSAYGKTISTLQALNPALASVAPGQPFSFDLSALQENLAATHSSVIAYYITEGAVNEQGVDLAVAWVVDGKGIQMVELGLPGDELRSLVESMRSLTGLQNSTTDLSSQFEIASNTLYNALIGKLQSQLNGVGEDNALILIPHGSLHYLSFAALQNPKTKQYLIQEHPLFYAASASTLNLTDTLPLSSTIGALVLANPDDTLTKAKEEANAVAKQFATQPIIGVQATETTLISQTILLSQTSNVNVLHIVAHGSFDATQPLSSSLVLNEDQENDGNLQASEVFALNLHNTRFAVLSACATGVGEISRGDELTGLTRAFHYAGVPTVMTSLWNVDDEATAQLMEHFYKNLLAGQTAAKALQNTQIALLEDEQHQQPFYWASFQLNGNGLQTIQAGDN